MGRVEINTKIINKHDTEENWSKASGFSPMLGEIIVYDPDENYDYSRIKVGDGVTNVSLLPFVSTRPVMRTWTASDMT